MKTGDEKRLNKRLLLGEHQPATKALMQELFDSLEVEGLVCKTGLYEWGEKWGFQPVYCLTESGLAAVVELLRGEPTLPETEQPEGQVN
jgi:hypothetical protein